jgi:hypothetical protein
MHVYRRASVTVCVRPYLEYTPQSRPSPIIYVSLRFSKLEKRL